MQALRKHAYSTRLLHARDAMLSRTHELDVDDVQGTFNILIRCRYDYRAVAVRLLYLSHGRQVPVASMYRFARACVAGL